MYSVPQVPSQVDDGNSVMSRHWTNMKTVALCDYLSTYVYIDM